MGRLTHPGEVWHVELDIQTKGHEQARPRPALIISEEFGSMVVVLPITSRGRPTPLHVPIGKEAGLSSPSAILCDQIRAVSTKRISRRYGVASTDTLEHVERVLRRMLNLPMEP